MLTLNERQLKELDDLLDKLPHAYAKAVIILLQKFNLENKQADKAEKAETQPEPEPIEAE